MYFQQTRLPLITIPAKITPYLSGQELALTGTLPPQLFRDARLIRYIKEQGGQFGDIIDFEVFDQYRDTSFNGQQVENLQLGPDQPEVEPGVQSTP